MTFTMRKKSNANLRSPHPTPEELFPFPITSSSSVAPKGSFSAPAFDRFLVGDSPGKGGWEGRDAFADRNGRDGADQATAGGISKKLLAFPWGRDKKQSNASAPPSPLPAGPPVSTPLHATASLPLGFPPSPSEDPIRHSTLSAFPAPPSKAQQHATAFIAPHTGYKASDSVSTVSTSQSTSSFASSSLFNNTDEWESGSEATSLSITSSPESSKDSSGECKPQRMWRVKGLADSPLRVELEEPRGPGGGLRSGWGGDEEHASDSRRNSTPVPRMVAMMLADPETPPRLKRFSTSSSKPSPTSPPFDPAVEKAARALRGATTPSPPTSPESSGDADDEVSPPRAGAKAMAMRKENKGGDLLSASDQVYSTRTRIPSIRFEGISMEAVFAEVEKKMKHEVKEREELGESGEEKKAARRRTRVISAYRPMSYGEPDATTESTTVSPSASEMDALRCESTTPTPAAPLDAPRPRPYPRRTSSRPAPLDVSAANAIPTWRFNVTPTTGSTAIASPPLCGAFSPTPNRAPPVDGSSPRLEGAFSHGLPSPSLAEPFAPSPALSTTSTFRPFDIPEVCVFPPTPTPDDGDWETPINQVQQQPGPTKVVILEQKRMVRSSTRASTVRKSVRRVFVPPPEIETPPLSPACSTTSTIHSDGTRPLDSPTSVTSFGTTVATHDQNSSPLTVHQVEEDSSSDCEDALHNMLMRLNRPHTPPTDARPSRSLSLTTLALELHNTSHNSLSMLAREMGRFAAPNGLVGPTITVTDTEAQEEEENDDGEAATTEWESASTSNVEMLTTAYESDDSAARFGDAPLRIFIPQPISAAITHQSLVDSPRAEEEADSEVERLEEPEVDLLDLEITKTLASIESSSSIVPSTSSLSLSSSSSSLSSLAFLPASSSISYSSSSSSVSRRLPHSRSMSDELVSASDTTDSEADGDGYDSLDNSEVGVVMRGERVSCAYDVGVIGMAI